MDVSAESGELRHGLRIPATAGNCDYTDIILQVATPTPGASSCSRKVLRMGAPSKGSMHAVDSRGRRGRLTWEQILSGIVVQAPPTLSRPLLEGFFSLYFRDPAVGAAFRPPE